MIDVPLFTPLLPKNTNVIPLNKLETQHDSWRLQINAKTNLNRGRILLGQRSYSRLHPTRNSPDGQSRGVTSKSPCPLCRVNKIRPSTSFLTPGTSGTSPQPVQSMASTNLGSPSEVVYTRKLLPVKTSSANSAKMDFPPS